MDSKEIDVSTLAGVITGTIDVSTLHGVIDGICTGISFENTAAREPFLLTVAARRNEETLERKQYVTAN